MWRQLPLSRNVGSLHLLLSVIINPVFLPREAGDSLFCVCMRERAESEDMHAAVTAGSHL